MRFDMCFFYMRAHSGVFTFKATAWRARILDVIAAEVVSHPYY